MSAPKTPLLATDCIVFDRKGRVLLILRGRPPYKSRYALPGGFVEIGERRRPLAGASSRRRRGSRCAS